MLVPIKRVTMFGDDPQRVATKDAGSPGEMPLERVSDPGNLSTPIPPVNGQPASVEEALANGMQEVGRWPNDAGYALLVDQTSNEVVLFAMPLPEARRDDPNIAGRWPAYAGPDDAARNAEPDADPGLGDEVGYRPGEYRQQAGQPWAIPANPESQPAQRPVASKSGGRPAEARTPSSTYVTNQQGRNAPMMAPERELAVSERDWEKYATGTTDAAQRAFDNRVERARGQVRMRSINDRNRARFGQPPVGGGPYKPAA